MKKKHVLITFIIPFLIHGQTMFSPTIELGSGLPWVVNVGFGGGGNNQVVTVNFKTVFAYNEISASYGYYFNNNLRVGVSVGSINKTNLFNNSHTGHGLFIGTNISYKILSEKEYQGFIGQPELTLGLQCTRKSKFGIPNGKGNLYFIPSFSINIPMSLKRKKNKTVTPVSNNEIIEEKLNTESAISSNRMYFEESIKTDQNRLNKYLKFKEKGVELDFNISKEKMNAIIDNVKTYIGTPYRYSGTSKSGIDCSGLLYNGFNSQGINIPRVAQEIARLGILIYDQDNLNLGDLVFFTNTTPVDQLITHMGLYLGDGDFIHSSSSKGVVISKINDPYYWRDKFLFGKRILK